MECMDCINQLHLTHDWQLDALVRLDPGERLFNA